MRRACYFSRLFFPLGRMLARGVWPIEPPTCHVGAAMRNIRVSARPAGAWLCQIGSHFFHWVFLCVCRPCTGPPKHLFPASRHFCAQAKRAVGISPQGACALTHAAAAVHSSDFSSTRRPHSGACGNAMPCSSGPNTANLAQTICGSPGRDTVVFGAALDWPSRPRGIILAPEGGDTRGGREQLGLQGLL
jgi:hypothetical protein